MSCLSMKQSPCNHLTSISMFQSKCLYDIDHAAHPHQSGLEDAPSVAHANVSVGWLQKHPFGHVLTRETLRTGPQAIPRLTFYQHGPAHVDLNKHSRLCRRTEADILRSYN